MGLLGVSAVAEMQKSLKQNKALLRKGRSLKDVSKNYPSPLKNMTFHENKFSEKDVEAFKVRLALQRQKDKRKRQMLLISLVIIGSCVLLLMHI